MVLKAHFGSVETIEKLEGGIENEVYKVVFSCGAKAVARIYKKTHEEVLGTVRLLGLIDGDVRCPSLIEPAMGEYPLTVVNPDSPYSLHKTMLLT